MNEKQSSQLQEKTNLDIMNYVNLLRREENENGSKKI